MKTCRINSFSVNLGFIIDNETLTFCICYYVIDILSAMINRLRDEEFFGTEAIELFLGNSFNNPSWR